MATVKIHGIDFRIKNGNVYFQNGMFTGKKNMKKDEFEQMVQTYVPVTTRNGKGIEPKGNKFCDDEIYPA